MVNEDILTSLRNAIENGESLQQAMDVLANSGYNTREVQEAARFLGHGVIGDLELRNNETLIVPNQKNVLGVPRNLKVKSMQNPNYNNEMTQIKQEVSSGEPIPKPDYSMPLASNVSSAPLAAELNKIAPPKPGYKKEIILIVILLILVGALIATILFRNKILGFFS